MQDIFNDYIFEVLKEVKESNNITITKSEEKEIFEAMDFKKYEKELKQIFSNNTIKNGKDLLNVLENTKIDKSIFKLIKSKLKWYYNPK